MPANAPVFYDCEASALSGAPIEVGWAFVEADTGLIISEAHLIRPPSDWAIEDSWDPEAEALHGILLDLLQAQGRPAWEVAKRMNAALRGGELLSDSPHDEAWLMQLFDEAGSIQHSRFGEPTRRRSSPSSRKCVDWTPKPFIAPSARPPWRRQDGIAPNRTPAASPPFGPRSLG